MTFVGKDYFVPVVDAIGIQVIRVKDCQVDVFSVGALFRYSLKREASGEFRYTQSLLPPPGNRTGFLGAASSHSDPNEHDPLFCFVPETPCSI